MLGVPLGTFIGQQFGWRSPFVVLTAVATLTCVLAAAFLPPASRATGSESRGSTPSSRGYALLVAATAVGVTGVMTAQTYITPFLLEVPHFAARWLGALLLVGGLAGVVGAVVVGRFLDRSPAAALAGPLLILTIALAGLRLFGPWKAYAVIGVALAGLGLSALAAALQNRTLQLSPMSVDVGSAGVSSAFNVGIAAGSYLGGVLIASHGVRSVTSAGALLTLAALVVVCADIAIARRFGLGAADL